MRLLTVILGCLTFLFIHTASYAILIEPSIEFTGSRGDRIYTFTVTNNETKPFHVQFKFMDFIKDINGNPVVIQESNPRSCKDWVMIDPLTDYLKPKESKKFRIIFDPPSQLKEGSYWSALSIQPLYDEELLEQQVESGIIKTGVSARGAVVAQLFYQEGKIKPTGELTDMRFRQDNPSVVDILYLNNSEYKYNIQGYIQLLNVMGDEVHRQKIPNYKTLPHCPFMISYEIPIEFVKRNENYIVLCVIDNGGDELIGGELVYSPKK